MQTEQLASELLRALRGKRSQMAFSRRLGYSSNVCYSWETGRAFPTATRFFRIIERTVGAPEAKLSSFYGREKDWLRDADLTTPSGLVALLLDLRGRRRVAAIAERMGRGRFTVSRWFQGKAEPRLPELLQLVEALTLRSLDFIACFADPMEIPSAAAAWRSLESARRVAYDAPWSHAVLRALELESYRSLPQHIPGWIAARVGITAEQEQDGLLHLEQAGQISMKDGRWRVRPLASVDTGARPDAARRLREYWTGQAVERLNRGAPGIYSYNLVSVSLDDLARIAAIHRSYFREIREVVSKSAPEQCVALITMNLVELGGILPTEAPDGLPDASPTRLSHQRRSRARGVP